jgi:hypothetical protein
LLNIDLILTKCISFSFISLQGVTVTFPARSITVILSAKSPSAPASKSIQSDVLQAIYGSLSSPSLSHAQGAADSMTGAGAGTGTEHDRVQIGGSVWVHGRELSEWSLKALRERITFMKDGELDLSLPAGKSLLRCLDVSAFSHIP